MAVDSIRSCSAFLDCAFNAFRGLCAWSACNCGPSLATCSRFVLIHIHFLIKWYVVQDGMTFIPTTCSAYILRSSSHTFAELNVIVRQHFSKSSLSLSWGYSWLPSCFCHRLIPATSLGSERLLIGKGTTISPYSRRRLLA